MALFPKKLPDIKIISKHKKMLESFLANLEFMKESYEKSKTVDNHFVSFYNSTKENILRMLEITNNDFVTKAERMNFINKIKNS